MTTFIAMEPPRAPPGEHTRFVPDRFVLVAFLLPLIWLLYHRLWLEALLVLAVGAVLSVLSGLPGFDSLAAVLGLLLSFLIALESGALRIAALSRRGWRQSALVDARGRADAEMRYLAELPARGELAAAPASPARPASAERIGMVDYPGAR